MILSSNGCAPRIVSDFSFKGASADNLLAEEERSRRRGCSGSVADAGGSAVPPTDASSMEQQSSPPPTPVNQPTLSPVTGDGEHQPAESPAIISQQRPPHNVPPPSRNASPPPRNMPPPPRNASPPPRNALPPPPTTPSHEDSAVDPSMDTNHPERSTIPSLTTGVFKLNAPLSFITPATIEYWGSIRGGQSWVGMVNAYLQLEQTPIPQDVSTFFPLTRNPY